MYCCIVGDEVGGNFSQKDDGHIVGTLEVILVKRVMVILVVHYIYAKEMLLPNLKRPTKINVLH